jgi:hypothetical protein
MAVIIITSSTTIIQVKVLFQILWHKILVHYSPWMEVIDDTGSGRMRVEVVVAAKRNKFFVPWSYAIGYTVIVFDIAFRHIKTPRIPIQMLLYQFAPNPILL